MEQSQEQVRRLIKSDAINKNLNMPHQDRHFRNSGGYIEGRSYFYDDVDPGALIDQYHGTGDIRFTDAGNWINKEFIVLERDIGVHIEQKTGVQTATNSFSIHYGKKGAHIVPSRRQK